MVPLTKVVAASDCADTALGTTPLRRANPSQQRPARRIAGRKSFFQTFINPLLGRRGIQHICWMLPSLAPGNHGLPPMPLDGAGHHATGRAAVAPGRSLNRDRNLNARMIRATPNERKGAKPPSEDDRAGQGCEYHQDAEGRRRRAAQHEPPAAIVGANRRGEHQTARDDRPGGDEQHEGEDSEPGPEKSKNRRNAVTMLAAP